MGVGVGVGGMSVFAAAIAMASPSALQRDAAVSVPLQPASGPTALVRRGLRLHGLPLRGAYEVARSEPGAGERVLASRLPRAAPRLRPAEAVISAEAVVERLVQQGAPPSTVAPRLVYRLVLGTPVLAWEVSLPFEARPQPSLRTLWFGAGSGRLIEEHDAVFFSRARVFAEDPSTTPEPVEVELVTLEVDAEGQPLRSAGFEVFGCGDTPVEDEPPWGAGLGCSPRQLARSDAAGDYLVPLPNIAVLDDNRTPDDAYAEVAAYHYAERFFEVMGERGLTRARCEHFTIAVNIHSRAEDGEIAPMDGASYVDQCNPDASPQMIVGQGRDVDYAYDAGVLYHELGHSVIQDLAPAGLQDRRYTPLGILSEAGAINEGVADYLSMSVSGDPAMAEYVGRYSVASGAPYLRHGHNQKVCPDDLIADWHHDSQPVSAALWAIRARLGPERTDGLVLQTLVRLPPDAVLDDFGAALLEVAAEQHAAGQLDDFGLALVERSLEARGLLDCLHVIDDPGLATTGKRMLLLAADDRIQPLVPGPMQLRYEVPEDAHEVTIWLTLSGGDPEQRAMSLLVSREGEPVRFEYEVRPPTADEEADEVIMVTADHAVELEAESLNGEDFIARLPVEPGEVLHVALANRTPARVSASNFFVVASEPSRVDVPDQGCGCRGSSRGAGPGGWWLVLLAGWRRGRGRLGERPAR